VSLDDYGNDDWIKHSFDCWLPSGKQVTTLSELRQVFSAHTDEQLTQFLRAPVEKLMPEPLRSELRALARQLRSRKPG
jgi:hypothetical protein